MRIVNFAQGELVMLGMYGAFFAYSLLGIDPYLSMFWWCRRCSCSASSIQRLVHRSRCSTSR